MICIRPRDLLFNDLSPAETDKWMSVLQPQPLSGWGMTTEYAGWTEIPSVYLICENDQVLPASLQEQMATVMGARIERCESGHMVMLTMPEKVVGVIRSAVEEI
jgi:pimeloyl-ACP methyl ester carboxylesterase